MEQPGKEGFQPSTRARCPRSIVRYAPAQRRRLRKLLALSLNYVGAETLGRRERCENIIPCRHLQAIDSLASFRREPFLGFMVQIDRPPFLRFADCVGPLLRQRWDSSAFPGCESSPKQLQQYA